ncbi:hypothetical protein E3N88_29822 [Mikania micrantha]|uniref:Uncharacterized protein n=1 Tax=Mikania micrantha TaxID=192012 RepID=A0A5N6MKV0_9ASTR|nr:hypothetical protein E3N88_29822 [Mikania micrantha]
MHNHNVCYVTWFGWEARQKLGLQVERFVDSHPHAKLVWWGSFYMTKGSATGPGEPVSAPLSPSSSSFDDIMISCTQVGFADQPFSPSWDVVNKDVFSNPVVASKVMREFVPPGQRLISSSMEDEELRNKVACLWAELGSLLPEMSQRWVSTSSAQEKNKTKLSIMNNKISQLQRDFSTMEKDREEESLRCLEIEKAYTEKEIFLNQQITEAKENLEHGLALLEKSRVELKEERREFENEKERAKLSLEEVLARAQSLQDQVTMLSADHDWIFSPVQKAGHEYGVTSGLKSGYRHAAAGHVLEKLPNYQPQAKVKLQNAVATFEGMSYPFLEAVAGCVKEPLSVLQGLLPEGYDAGEAMVFSGQVSPSQSTFATPSSATAGASKSVMKPPLSRAASIESSKAPLSSPKDH